MLLGILGLGMDGGGGGGGGGGGALSLSHSLYNEATDYKDWPSPSLREGALRGGRGMGAEGRGGGEGAGAKVVKPGGGCGLKMVVGGGGGRGVTSS